MKSNNEIYQKRKENNKRYTAYIPKFISNSLKENMEKYLKKN